MKNFIVLSLVSLFSVTAFAGQGVNPKANPTAAPLKIPGFDPAPKGVRIHFANLKNNQTVVKKFTVKFAVDGLKVQPAGEIVAGTGHHHLIIDGDAIPPGQVVPADATHIHFGKGQTETELELTPGKHKLTLQFANGAHLSYGPEVSDTVDIIVK